MPFQLDWGVFGIFCNWFFFVWTIVNCNSWWIRYVLENHMLDYSSTIIHFLHFCQMFGKNLSIACFSSEYHTHLGSWVHYQKRDSKTRVISGTRSITTPLILLLHTLCIQYIHSLIFHYCFTAVHTSVYVWCISKIIIADWPLKSSSIQSID